MFCMLLLSTIFNLFRHDFFQTWLTLSISKWRFTWMKFFKVFTQLSWEIIHHIPNKISYAKDSRQKGTYKDQYHTILKLQKLKKLCPACMGLTFLYCGDIPAPYETTVDSTCCYETIILIIHIIILIITI